MPEKNEMVTPCWLYHKTNPARICTSAKELSGLLKAGYTDQPSKKDYDAMKTDEAGGIDKYVPSQDQATGSGPETSNADLSARESGLNDLDIALAQKSTSLDKVETALTDREKDLDTRKSNLNTKASEVTERENGLQSREDSVTQRETAAQEKENALNERENVLNGRKAEIKKGEQPFDYAVMKEGREKPLRVLDTEQEAKDYIVAKKLVGDKTVTILPRERK